MTTSSHEESLDGFEARGDAHLSFLSNDNWDLSANRLGSEPTDFTPKSFEKSRHTIAQSTIGNLDQRDLNDIVRLIPREARTKLLRATDVASKQQALREIAATIGIGSVICLAVVDTRDSGLGPVAVVAYFNGDHSERVRKGARAKDFPIAQMHPLEWSSISVKGCTKEQFSQLLGDDVEGAQGWMFSERSISTPAMLLSTATDLSRNLYSDIARARLIWFQCLAYHVHMSTTGDAGHLTARESECLLWASKGKTADVTAEILGITRRAVKFHLDHARAKLGADNVTHAVMKAYQHNLLMARSGKSSALAK